MSGASRAILLVALLLPADSAHALASVEIASAVVHGLLQPLFKPAHALALLALGLLFGRHGRNAWQSWGISLGVFALALAAGLTAIALGVGTTPAIDVLIAATALAGLLLALQAPLPNSLDWLLAVVAGAALGLDSPPTATTIAAANATLIGTGLGACLALAIVAAGAMLIQSAWQRIGLRIVGSWIAASAILVLALRFSAALR